MNPHDEEAELRERFEAYFTELLIDGNAPEPFAKRFASAVSDLAANKASEWLDEYLAASDVRIAGGIIREALFDDG